MKSPHDLIALTIYATTLACHSLQAATVTHTGDSGTGSLRDAIANATPGEVIDFDPALNGATITLTSGHLLISSKQVIIDASSLEKGIAISGNNSHQIIRILGSTANVDLRNLELKNGNAAGINGGAIFHGGGFLSLSDCRIINNFATYNGGGIFLAFDTSTVIDRCLIAGNNASHLGFGGAIFVSGAAGTLIRNSAITGNSNPFAGGISISNSSPTIVNCTIQGNLGGGIWNDFNASPVIQNSIVWGNTRDDNPAVQQIRNTNNSSPRISHSLVQGASGSESFGDGNVTIWETGNLDGSTNNPAFVAASTASGVPDAGGDLRLRAASPAVNSGSNLAVSSSLDLLRQPRIKDSTVDMGAYEGGFVSFASLHPLLDPTADENGNGIANFQEYAMGFDPSATSQMGINPQISVENDTTLLTTSQRSNAFDVVHTLQTSTDLVEPWSELVKNVHYTLMTSTPATGDRKVVTLQLITSAPRRFYRHAFSLSEPN
jgi:hypothetical protein